MPLPALPPAPPPLVGEASLAARADAAMAHGAPEQAIALLTGQPRDLALGGRLGRALLAKGRYEDAARAFEAVLFSHRRVADPYLGTAWSYIAAGQFGMAQLPLSEGMRLAPRYEPGWRELGRCHYWLKRFDRAVAACDRAIALDPRDGDAWLTKGLSLALGGHEAGALPALVQASSLLRADPISRRMRGRLLLAAGRPADAEVALQASLRLAPADAEARRLLGEAYRRQGKHGQAFALWLAPKLGRTAP